MQAGRRGKASASPTFRVNPATRLSTVLSRAPGGQRPVCRPQPSPWCTRIVHRPSDTCLNAHIRSSPSGNRACSAQTGQPRNVGANKSCELFWFFFYNILLKLETLFKRREPLKSFARGLGEPVRAGPSQHPQCWAPSGSTWGLEAPGSPRPVARRPRGCSGLSPLTPGAGHAGSGSVAAPGRQGMRALQGACAAAGKDLAQARRSLAQRFPLQGRPQAAWRTRVLEGGAASLGFLPWGLGGSLSAAARGGKHLSSRTWNPGSLLDSEIQRLGRPLPRGHQGVQFPAQRFPPAPLQSIARSLDHCSSGFAEANSSRAVGAARGA